MKINNKVRKQLNKIAIKYSGWQFDENFVKIYDELKEFNVFIPAWQYWDKDNAHVFEINGEEVENSRFVCSKYEDINSNKNEYNLYFS